MEPFNWVSTGSIAKFNRAVKVLKDANVLLKAQGKSEVEVTEEAIKAQYVKYAGLLVETDEATPVVEEEVEEKPAHKKRNK